MLVFGYVVSAARFGRRRRQAWAPRAIPHRLERLRRQLERRRASGSPPPSARAAASTSDRAVLQPEDDGEARLGLEVARGRGGSPRGRRAPRRRSGASRASASPRRKWRSGTSRAGSRGRRFALVDDLDRLLEALLAHANLRAHHRRPQLGRGVAAHRGRPPARRRRGRRGRARPGRAARGPWPRWLAASDPRVGRGLLEAASGFRHTGPGASAIAGARRRRGADGLADTRRRPRPIGRGGSGSGPARSARRRSRELSSTSRNDDDRLLVVPAAASRKAGLDVLQRRGGAPRDRAGGRWPGRRRPDIRARPASRVRGGGLAGSGERGGKPAELRLARASELAADPRAGS